MTVQIIKPQDQAIGEFDGGKITEQKPFKKISDFNDFLDRDSISVIQRSGARIEQRWTVSAQQFILLGPYVFKGPYC